MYAPITKQTSTARPAATVPARAPGAIFENLRWDGIEDAALRAVAVSWELVVNWIEYNWVLFVDTDADKNDSGLHASEDTLEAATKFAEELLGLWELAEIVLVNEVVAALFELLKIAVDVTIVT